MTKRSLFMWVLDIFTCFKHGRYLHYHCAYYFDNFNFSKSDLSNGSVVSNGFKLKLFAKFSNNYFGMFQNYVLKTLANICFCSKLFKTELNSTVFF